MNLFGHRAAFWILGSALIAPFLVLALYVTPQADDFGRGAIAERDGVLAELRYNYAVTDGRFAATALQACCGLNLERSVALGPFVFMAAWWLASWRCLFVVSAVLWPIKPARRRARFLYTGGLALFLLGFYLTRMPSPCQGFYWLNAAQTYTAACIAGWLLIAELVRLFDPQTTNRAGLWRHSLTAAALTALLIGFNEIAMFLWDLALVALLILVMAKRWRWMWLAPTLATAVLASAVVVKSPSNALRAAQYPTSKQPVKAAARALLHTAIKIGVWSLDPALWLGSLLLVAAWRRWPTPARLDWLHRRWALPTLAIMTVGILTLAAFPAYYGMGHAPPQRACNMLYLVFASGWIAVLIALATARPQWSPIQLKSWTLPLALFLFGSWPFAVWDGASAAPAYRSEYVARSQAVADALARGERRIEFEPLRHRPRLLFYADLHNESDYWINIMYARRVHLDAVTLRDRQSTMR